MHLILTSLLLTLALPVTGMIVREQARSGPAGRWTGLYTTSESGGDLDIEVKRAGQDWQVAVRATSQYVADPKFLDASAVRVRGDSVAFVLEWGTPVRWVGVVRGDSLAGVLNADHWSGSFRVKRTPKP
jgi:hypothetical protein